MCDKEKHQILIFEKKNVLLTLLFNVIMLGTLGG